MPTERPPIDPERVEVDRPSIDPSKVEVDQEPKKRGVLADIGKGLLETSAWSAGQVAAPFAAAGGAVVGLPQGMSKAAEIQDKISHAMQPEPTTKTGKALTGILGFPFEMLTKGIHAVGSAVAGEAPGTARSALAAGTEGILAALPALLGGKKVGGSIKAAVPSAKSFVTEFAKGLEPILDPFIKALVPRKGVPRASMDAVMKLKGTRDFEIAKLDTLTEELEKRLSGFTQEDLVAFHDRYKQGIGQPAGPMKVAESLLRKMDEKLFDLVEEQKPGRTWLDNHDRIMWKKIPKTPEQIAGMEARLGTMTEEELRSELGPSSMGMDRAQMEARVHARRPIVGSRGFLKRHTLDTMSEGLERGGEPYSYNPITNFKQHFADVLKYVTAQSMWNKFKDLGMRKFVKLGEKAPEGFSHLNDRIARVYFPVKAGMVHAGEWLVEDNSARILNNFLSRDLIRESPTGRGLMGLKNMTTAVELSLSPFHALFETFEIMSQSLGLGAQKAWNMGIAKGNLTDFAGGVKEMLIAPAAPVNVYRTGGKVFSYLKGPEDFIKNADNAKFLREFPHAQDLIADLFTGGGQVGMHQDYKLNSLRVFQDAWKNKDYVNMAVRTIPALNEVMLKPLFNHYIPRLKAGMFLKQYSHRLDLLHDDIKAGKITKEQLASRTWDFIEDTLGEMNFDNLFWNRTFKSSLQLIFRSVTWKLGNLRAFGKAFVEQGKELSNAMKEKRVPRLEPEMAWLWGLATTTVAMNSIIQKLAIGEFPQDLKDTIFPRISEKGDRMAPYTYLKDAAAIAHGPIKYMLSSFSGWLGAVAEIGKNRTYSGTQVYDPEASYAEKTMDAMVHLFPTPFSIQNIERTKKPGEPIYKGFLSGIAMKAPGYIQNTPAETRALELRGDAQYKAMTKTEKEKKLKLQNYADSLGESRRSSDPGEEQIALDQIAKDKTLTQKDVEQIISLATHVRLERLCKNLSLSETLKVWEEASPEERMTLAPLLNTKIGNASEEKLQENMGAIKKFSEDFNKIDQQKIQRTKLERLQKAMQRKKD